MCTKAMSSARIPSHGRPWRVMDPCMVSHGQTWGSFLKAMAGHGLCMTSLNQAVARAWLLESRGRAPPKKSVVSSSPFNAVLANRAKHRGTKILQLSFLADFRKRIWKRNLFSCFFFFAISYTSVCARVGRHVFSAGHRADMAMAGHGQRWSVLAKSSRPRRLMPPRPVPSLPPQPPTHPPTSK